MASDQISSDSAPEYQNSSDPAPKCQTMALNHDSLSPVIQRQGKVVSKYFAVSAADAPNQRQQYTTPLNNHTTPAPSCQIPTLAPTVISPENINQAETYAKNDQVADDEFINIFSNPVQDQGETSTRHLADLFTKALPVERFQYLVRRLGMKCLTPAELEALANQSA
nr:ribonuclease H-like domain-containing protein [Tanacetum cinerariifolium]